MRVYTEDRDTPDRLDEEQDPLPELTEGQILDLLALTPK